MGLVTRRHSKYSQRERYKRYLRLYYLDLLRRERAGRPIRPAPKSLSIFLRQIFGLLARKNSDGRDPVDTLPRATPAKRKARGF